MLKILLADDHQLIRDGLRTLLFDLLSEPPTCLEACSFEQAHAQLALHPDIQLAIIDLKMSDAANENLLTTLATAFEKVPLIVLSGYLQSEVVQRLLALPSVHAVTSKGGDPDTLRFVVLETLAGRHVGDAHRLIDGTKAGHQRLPTAPHLSPRLQQIYTLLCEGNSNKAIAWKLNLSEGTVKNYVSAIYKQLSVHNRIQAAWKDTSPERERHSESER